MHIPDPHNNNFPVSDSPSLIVPRKNETKYNCPLRHDHSPGWRRSPHPPHSPTIPPVSGSRRLLYIRKDKDPPDPPLRLPHPTADSPANRHPEQWKSSPDVPRPPRAMPCPTELPGYYYKRMVCSVLLRSSACCPAEDDMDHILFLS